MSVLTDGRYLIRHYWGGKRRCDSPQYGQWGGPPNGRQPARPSPAKDLASAPRGQVQLAAMVKSKVPALGLPGLGKRGKPVGSAPPLAGKDGAAPGSGPGPAGK